MRAITSLVLLLLVSGCGQPESTTGKPADPSPSVDTPMAGMQSVMRAKLLHVNTLLEAIAMNDMTRVEQSAEALTWLSEQSDFQVHMTESYGVYSRQFRDVTKAMAEHARQRDSEAVGLDYIQMTHSCMTCHSYLRREGLIRDMPGRES